MGKESKDKELTFNGFQVGKRATRKDTESLAASILERSSVDDLRRDLRSQGFGLEEIDSLLSTLGKRPARGNISEVRRKALERLQDARFSMIGTPPDLREPGDRSRSESGKGRLILPDKFIPED